MRANTFCVIVHFRSTIWSNFGANSIFGHNYRDNLNMAKILVQANLYQYGDHLSISFKSMAQTVHFPWTAKNCALFSVPGVKFGLNLLSPYYYCCCF